MTIKELLVKVIGFKFDVHFECPVGGISQTRFMQHCCSHLAFPQKVDVTACTLFINGKEVIIRLLKPEFFESLELNNDIGAVVVEIIPRSSLPDSSSSSSSPSSILGEDNSISLLRRMAIGIETLQVGVSSLAASVHDVLINIIPFVYFAGGYGNIHNSGNGNGNDNSIGNNNNNGNVNGNDNITQVTNNTRGRCAKGNNRHNSRSNNVNVHRYPLLFNPSDLNKTERSSLSSAYNRALFKRSRSSTISRPLFSDSYQHSFGSRFSHVTPVRAEFPLSQHTYSTMNRTSTSTVVPPIRISTTVVEPTVAAPNTTAMNRTETTTTQNDDQPPA